MAGDRIPTLLPIAALIAAMAGCASDGAVSASGVPDSGDAELADAGVDADDNPADLTGEPDVGETDMGSDGGVDEGDSAQADIHEVEGDDVGIDEGPDSSLFEQCFAEFAPTDGEVGPEYDQFEPVIGSHCAGTNHQDITGIERVVFLGDSVTVGTPPTLAADYYRSILAEELADTFALDEPNPLWRSVNVLDGVALLKESGDFASCAKWGARTDDLLRGGNQLDECFEGDDFERRTLVIMTMGGNDLANLTEGFSDGESIEDLWDQTYAFVDEMRESVEWLTEPGRFPNGIYVVFTNLYEFTDATGDVTACPTASLAGFGAAVEDPELAEMVVWSMEQFMSIAVDTGTDMLFLLESFCGHGFNRDDSEGRCYRGPGAELWFDLTCIHPNPAGHEVIADMFLSVVQE